MRIVAAAFAVCAIVASITAIFVARKKSIEAVRRSSALTLLSAACSVVAVVVVLLS